MVTVALILLLITALALAGWEIYDLRRDLDDALGEARRACDVAEEYLSALREAGLINAVTSCERTKGGTRP